MDTPLIRAIDKAKYELRLRSDREYSLHLKKNQNYIFNLREGAHPSPDMLARIMTDAGMDPSLTVLEFIRDQQHADARPIIERAIAALRKSAAALSVVIFAVSIASIPTPSLSAQEPTANPAPSRLYIMRQSSRHHRLHLPSCRTVMFARSKSAATKQFADEWHLSSPLRRPETSPPLWNTMRSGEPNGP